MTEEKSRTKISQIVEAVRSYGQPMTTQDLAELLGFEEQSVRNNITSYIYRRGLRRRQAVLTYEPAGRIVTFAPTPPRKRATTAVTLPFAADAATVNDATGPAAGRDDVPEDPFDENPPDASEPANAFTPTLPDALANHVTARERGRESQLVTNALWRVNKHLTDAVNEMKSLSQHVEEWRRKARLYDELASKFRELR